MCFAKLFRRKSEPLSLPHPEESPNPSATPVNTDTGQVREKWLSDWGVPVQWRDFWRSVGVRLVPDLYVLYNGQLIKVPAATSSETHHIDLDPIWCNPGVMAHENCHIAWAYLADEQRMAFGLAYRQSKAPLVQLVLDKMSDKDPNWRNNIIEVHADLYRYLGQSLPEELKKFYPKLV